MSSVDFLFTPTVQRVLGATLIHPDQSFTLQDLLRRGRLRSIRANTEFFLYSELRSIALKTFGLIEPIQAALQAYGDRIEEAFIFGSVVKGSDSAKSDIDVMVVGEVPQMDLFEASSRLRQDLGPKVADVKARPALPSLAVPAPRRQSSRRANRNKGACDGTCARRDPASRGWSARRPVPRTQTSDSTSNAERDAMKLHALLTAVGAVVLSTAASASPITLDFENVAAYPNGNNVFIQNFYNGGTASNGFTGTNYGVSFGSNALLGCLNSTTVFCSNGSRGGLAPTSSQGSLFFLSGNQTYMNVAAGFGTGFSFNYSSLDQPGSVDVYDGLNGTGNLLSTVSLTPNAGACPG